MAEMEITGETDDGGFRIEGREGEDRYVGVVPGALLDEQLGAGAGPADRREWIRSNAMDVFEALRARAEGGTPPAPFDRIGPGR